MVRCCKTASSVAITDGISSNKKIIVLLPASLRTNYENEVKTWGNILFKKQQYWCFVKSRVNSKIKKKLWKEVFQQGWIRKTGKRTKREKRC